MRNPIRLKNFSTRFLPLYVIGLALLVFHPPSPEMFGLAMPLIAAGAVLRGWGAGHLVKNDRLTTSGPYAHVRHPLYVGTILIATGFGILLGGWPLLLALALIWPWFAFHYFPRKEETESHRLQELYGERFSRYRNAVPALWPRFRAWCDEESDGASTLARPWAFECYSENNELGTLLAVGAGVLIFWLRGWVGG